LTCGYGRRPAGMASCRYTHSLLGGYLMREKLKQRGDGGLVAVRDSPLLGGDRGAVTRLRAISSASSQVNRPT
jgi:hypothetical protein